MLALHQLIRSKRAPRNVPVRSQHRRRKRSNPCAVEVLEGRELLSTFTVSNLDPTGTGSLRWAIQQANANPGPDTIDFGLTGTIRAGRTALPAIRDTVTIDGTTAPSYAGTPLVTVDFQGTRGFRFERGSDGSVLRGLSIVKAGGAGVALSASRITVQSNYIGLQADGKTPGGSRGDGVQINASSHDNLIGRADPVTSITYYNADGVSMQPVSGWQGIRAADTPGQYLITGTSNANGLLYIGPISGVGGTSYAVNYPGATTTSVYGPDNLGNGVIRLVGTYKTGDDMVYGFVFEGTTADLTNPDNYRTIAYPGAKFNYVHSTMGGLAVGNYDGPTESGQPVGPGHGYIYNVATGQFLTDIVFPGSVSNTAYGIWYNGGTSYTICGGFSQLPVSVEEMQTRPIGMASLVDYDSATGQFSNWKSFSYPNGPAGAVFDTHFQGISSVEKGVYTLNAGAALTSPDSPLIGSWVTVRRDADGSFGDAAWVDLSYPGISAPITSDSVIGNQLVGIVLADTGVFSYQATVNIGFQLSNVISGNAGNGIGIYGSNDNHIAMNYIGTDASGTLARGNGGNGILVTRGAARNRIGGQATGGNNPTAGVFVRPPQGNLISANRGNGVLIEKGATRNVLSGNFVGTDASGNAALGNRLDGVAIDRADNNELIGCTFQESPFVFYNVLSGNRGNGLRITSANNTTVHANFLGAGANNATIVANGGNGLLVNGSAKNTQVGGVIPLGNVISGNNRNGIEVRDTASGFVSFNTFAGIFAFAGAAPNRQNGILITSRGGNNLIRTCIVSGNLGNGIELGGQATGVQITDTAVGTNTAIQSAIPNQGSGVKISGNAHGNAIGGFQPSVEPQVTISANGRYGIEIVGSAHDNAVFNTKIGTTAESTGDLGNGLGGILLGPGTSSTTIGGAAPPFRNRIFNSRGNGVTIWRSRANTLAGNDIARNQGFGVEASGACNGTVIRDNRIRNNSSGDVNLTDSQGIVYIP
jgi:parallel beta-helix repeat protein